MKNLCLILLLIGLVFTAQAQSTEEAKVTDVVNNLFKAMYTNDTTLFKSVFADQVTMATAMKNREGKSVLQRESGIHAFVKAIANPNPNGPLTEEIWNIKVQIDGDLAHAQSHCLYGLRRKDGQTVALGAARYIDRLERRAGEWRIAHRRTLIEWRGELKSHMPEGYAQGAWDHSDPSYERPLAATATQPRHP